MSERLLNYYCSGTCDSLQTFLPFTSIQFNIPRLRGHPQIKKTAGAAISQPGLQQGKTWSVMDNASQLIIFFSFFTTL